MNKNYAILVDSCKKYFDCWRPMLQCLDKFWINTSDDNEISKYLVTDEIEDSVFKNQNKKLSFDKVLIYHEKQWGKLLQLALNNIDEEYVFLLLEDQWPAQKFEAKNVDSTLKMMEKDKEIGVVYFEKPTMKYSDITLIPQLVEIKFGTVNRISLAPSLWRKSYLLDILRDQDTPWDFERLGTYRIESSAQKVYRFKDSIFIRCAPPGAIEKGKWLRKIKTFTKENEIIVDFTQRKTQSRLNYIYSKIKAMIYSISPEMIVKIQNYMNKSKNR